MIKSLNNLPTNTFQQNEESKKENVKKQKTVTLSVKKGMYDKYFSSTNFCENKIAIFFL